MSKRKLIEIKKIKKENFVLANQSINAKNHPEINFKYLWKCNVGCFKSLSKYNYKYKETSVYKGYKQDKIEMRGDRAEMSDFPLYLNMVAGGLDCRDQAIGGFSFVVKIYAVPVVEIIG